MPYNPNQPREPAGTETGGQWASEQMGITMNAYIRGEAGRGDGLLRDENGNPITVYHGTSQQFDEFDVNKATNYHTQQTGVKLAFFSGDKGVASTYGENITEYNLSMNNPLVVDAEGKEWSDMLPIIQKRFTVYHSDAERDFREYQSSLMDRYGGDFYDRATDLERAQLESFGKAFEKVLQSGKNNQYIVPKYDGMIIKNVYDQGVLSPSVDEFNPYTTVYAVTSNKQIHRVKK